MRRVGRGMKGDYAVHFLRLSPAYEVFAGSAFLPSSSPSRAGMSSSSSSSSSAPSAPPGKPAPPPSLEKSRLLKSAPVFDVSYRTSGFTMRRGGRLRTTHAAHTAHTAHASHVTHAAHPRYSAYTKLAPNQNTMRNTRGSN